MTKQMNVNELKTLMNLAGWTHTQTTEITKRADNGNLTGIVEITSKNQNVPFEIHYNEGFEYNSETGTVTVDKENVYGLWWFVDDIEVVDKNGEKINSFDLDECGFPREFSRVDYTNIQEDE